MQSENSSGCTISSKCKINGFSLFDWPIYGSHSSGSKKSEEKNEQPILSIESNKESEITLINKKLR